MVGIRNVVNLRVGSVTKATTALLDRHTHQKAVAVQRDISAARDVLRLFRPWDPTQKLSRERDKVHPIMDPVRSKDTPVCHHFAACAADLCCFQVDQSHYLSIDC
ncbi:hypothetical protein TNCV_765671 [Trichonephila clavipes]|nr:hypothetical protein TNCV_765671 [Trichonephila clavipes]